MMRVEIPYEIVKARDCAKYREWIHDNYVAAGFIASDRCPWRTPPRGPVAEFVLQKAEIPFWIPRKYLWLDSNEPDGPVPSIHVMLAYPNMQPPTTQDDVGNFEIRVTVHSNYVNDWCQPEPQYCGNRQQKWWEDMYDPMIKGDGTGFVEHKKVQHLQDENLDEYTIKGERYGIYIRGPFEKPILFYKCNENATNPGCHSSFNYNDKIFIDYFFNRKLLPFHDNIRTKINEHISQWLKQGEQEND